MLPRRELIAIGIQGMQCELTCNDDNTEFSLRILNKEGQVKKNVRGHPHEVILTDLDQYLELRSALKSMNIKKLGNLLVDGLGSTLENRLVFSEIKNVVAPNYSHATATRFMPVKGKNYKEKISDPTQEERHCKDNSQDRRHHKK